MSPTLAAATGAVQTVLAYITIIGGRRPLPQLEPTTLVEKLRKMSQR